jgi:uncharacterized membrane protein HdeD (DUF308 family)
MSQASGASRALEIILGIVAIAIGILALIYPAGVVVTIVVLFGIALLIIGILRLATSFSPNLPSSAKGVNALIGVIALILGILILFFPTFATISLVVLIGIGLVIYGIGRAAVGSVATDISGGARALVITFGILVAIFGLIVIFIPTIGVFTYAFFVSIAFLLIGIDALVSGITGRRVM